MDSGNIFIKEYNESKNTSDILYRVFTIERYHIKRSKHNMSNKKTINSKIHLLR
jgi:hypothetical protein